MEFLNTTYLWGFLGIILPLAIHLWSRKKVVTIKVGSIKLLQASEPKQTSNLKLNEWWLLLLRILMVSVLVLILSEPVLTKTVDNQSINYIVESSLLNDNRLSLILDTIPEEKVRVLAKDFPYAKDFQDLPSSSTSEYWQLAQEMHNINADSLVVFSKGYLRGIKGKRPSIAAHTKWIVLEPENELETPIFTKQKEDYLEMTTVLSNGYFLMLKKDSISRQNDLLEFNRNKDSVRWTSPKIDWLPLTKEATLKVGMLSNDSLSEQVYYFKAAYRALSKFLDQPIEIITDAEVLSSAPLNTLIVLNDQLPQGFGGNVLIYQPNALANELIEAGPNNHTFYLTELLDSENIITNRFTEQLLVLLSASKNLEKFIRKSDQRILAENELQPVVHISTTKPKIRTQFFEMSSWLWFFLIPIAILERILSRFRKQ